MSEHAEQKYRLPPVCEVHFTCADPHPRLGENAVLQCCKVAGHEGGHFFRAITQENAAALRATSNIG